MSSTPSTGAADLARHARNLCNAAAAHLTGKKRGPDVGEGRRVPRRHSFDVDDPQAKPWCKIGDGSVRQGLVHREALLQTAEELVHQEWRENPADRVRAARARHEQLSAELDAHLAAGEAPIGRLAALRMEVAELAQLMARAADRLRRLDVLVLQAVLKRVDFATGRLFPAIATIAAEAGCHRNSVVAALRRLKAKGFLDWVRRTVKTGADGEFAPQREQTSNAYFFDHRRGMASRTFQRFTQILVAKLRRLGAVPAGVARGAAEVTCPELRAALDSLGSKVPNAST